MGSWKVGLWIAPAVVLGVLSAPGAFDSKNGPPGADAEVVNSIGMKLVRIPAGEFGMGSQEPAEEVLRAFPARRRTREQHLEAEHSAPDRRLEQRSCVEGRDPGKVDEPLGLGRASPDTNTSRFGEVQGPSIPRPASRPGEPGASRTSSSPVRATPSGPTGSSRSGS